MNTLNDIKNMNNNMIENNNEKLIKATTFVNGEKIFECSSGFNSLENVQRENDSVKILMNNKNISEHIISVIDHVNNHFIEKINENQCK
ncbi:conserved protein, unknown function [Hepatocystis sp. ex Piliocolobus tephrosceles]|nr:conserved protein, unknown function [Hepatocystis sp. ex Piliocolobus tephrosceles]